MNNFEVMTGEPQHNGVYLAYTAKSESTVFPTKEVLMREGGKWWNQSEEGPCKRMVLGWVGPLLSPTVDELLAKQC